MLMTVGLSKSMMAARMCESGISVAELVRNATVVVVQNNLEAVALPRKRQAAAVASRSVPVVVGILKMMMLRGSWR